MDQSTIKEFFAYGSLSLMVGGAIWVLLITIRDGYWGRHGEDVKYQIFNDDETVEGKS